MSDPKEEDDDDDDNATTTAVQRRRNLLDKLHSGPTTTLHGRQEQIRQLHKAFYKALLVYERRPPSVVLVSGNAGTGKSSLVVEFLEQVRRDNNGTIILHGKFDQFQQSSSAQDTIASAFAQISRSLKEDRKLRARVEQAVGLDASLLVQTIPGLAGSLTIPQVVSGVEECNGDIASIKARKRTTFLKFVRALASPTKPVVLFIDDLQWASPADFGVLSSILQEDRIDGLFIVFACRVVTAEHQLAIFLQNLASLIEIQDVFVSNLSLEAVSEYLSELLGEKDCTTLARSVFSKSAGNPFFLKELVATLLEEKRLIWREGSWHWDVEDSLEMRYCDQDILPFLTGKLKRLPKHMQDLLKAAACLGTTFGIESLQYLVRPDNAQRLDELLRRGQESGLLVRKTEASSTWSFAHDRIQQASYGLIPEPEREAFHLAIGRALRDRMDQGRLRAMMPVVVSQLILGHRLMVSQDERIHTATLLLEAGKQQARLSNFDVAGKFFSTGLKLLGDNCWSSYYHLSLELFNAQADVSYVQADFERLDTLTDIVCKHAESFDDTIQIHTTHVCSLGARNMLQAAMDEGLAVLEKLDEPIPRSVSSLRLFIEHLKTNLKLSRLSVRNLINLPDMTDPKKLAALRLLNLLFSYTYWKDDNKRALFLTIRSVQLTLEHGLCGMSAIGLVYYACFFCVNGETEKGSLLGRVAVSVVEKFNAKEWAGRVMLIKTSYVDPWKVPPRELTGTLESACQSCFNTGDIECALMARSLLFQSYYLSSQRDLEYVLGMCRSLYDQMQRYKQDALLLLFAPLMQLVANLSGQSESTTMLTGAFMDEQEIMNRGTVKQNKVAVQLILLCKLTLATVLWDFELARDQVKKLERLKQTNVLSPRVIVMELFYGGIALLSTDRPEVRKAKGKLRHLKRLSRQVPQLYTNKIFLLEAEIAAVRGNATKAMEKFLTSIALSQRQQLLHEQALACERMYLFMTKVGKLTEGIYFLNEARSLYQKWGCIAKVRHLDEVLLSTTKKDPWTE